jgi:hypothetical protein
MFRAAVTPFFTQPHGDVADVAQTQTFTVYPEGLTPLRTRETEETRPLLILARPMRDQVLQGLDLDCFPRPSNRIPKLPTPVGGVGIALHAHLHVLLGARRRIALNDHALGPRRAGHSGAPFHGTTYCPSGTLEGFSRVSDGRPWGGGRRPMWQSIGQIGSRKTTADARFFALFGSRDSASPAWVSHCHRPRESVPFLGGGRVWSAFSTHHVTSRCPSQ